MPNFFQILHFMFKYIHVLKQTQTDCAMKRKLMQCFSVPYMIYLIIWNLNNEKNELFVGHLY